MAGSGGWISADLTDEEVAKSKLVPNMEKHFLAPLGRLDEARMLRHFCKQCDVEFDGPSGKHIEESPDEEVADGLTLVERGQYTCHKCDSIIGEYRVFQKRQGC